MSDIMLQVIVKYPEKVNTDWESDQVLHFDWSTESIYFTESADKLNFSDILMMRSCDPSTTTFVK